MRQFIFILIAVLTISCIHTKTKPFNIIDNSRTNWSNDSISDIILVARLKRSYDSTIFYEDSVPHRTFDISISIVNKSKSKISFWMMYCSWYESFLLNNDYIGLCGWNCDANFPMLRSLNPNDSLILKTSVYRRESTLHQNILTTKFGFIYLDSSRYQSHDDWYKVMGDKSKWDNIIWSNPLYLRDK
jgi:hypothetical protein